MKWQSSQAKHISEETYILRKVGLYFPGAARSGTLYKLRKRNYSNSRVVFFPFQILDMNPFPAESSSLDIHAKRYTK